MWRPRYLGREEDSGAFDIMRPVSPTHWRPAGRARDPVTVMLPLVDLERQYRSIKEEIDTALLDAVASTDYVLGEELQRFEEDFAAYCGARCCVGVGSGTAAIHLALEALGISRGDEVIAPANTFFGSVLPVLRLGATPVLVDCDDVTATIDVEAVSAAVGTQTKAVLAVHLYGHPADIDPIAEVCASHGLALVEDACPGAWGPLQGTPAGSLGHAAAFSFYPSKNLGAYGDGGAVTTDDDELAERIRVLRNLGQSRRYIHELEGWNERLDTIQAAVLRVKLRHLDDWNAQRRRNAARVRAGSRDRVGRHEAAAWAEHVWHVFAVRTREARGVELRACRRRNRHSRALPGASPRSAGAGPPELRAGTFPVTEAWRRRAALSTDVRRARAGEIAAIAEVVDARTKAAA